MPRTSSHLTGAALVALALYFNLPFARLAIIFDYPDILRRPPDQIFAAFAAGGSELVLTWYAFVLAALLFVPVSMAYALGSGRLKTGAELAITAAIIGALAGLLQAVGLLRWVLVVPGLVATKDTAGFALIHAYAGLGLGEHLGQLVTALYVTLVAMLQSREAARKTALLGASTAALIAVGAMEGPILALGISAGPIPLAAIAGYLSLTLWLILSGVTLIRVPR